MGLRTAWAFLWEGSALTRLVNPDPQPHDFLLAADCNLPSGLSRGHRRFLREPPDCWCQWLLRDGRLKRAVNIVECTRLANAAEGAGDTGGLLFHASVPLMADGRPMGLINIAADEWLLFTAGDLQLLTAAGTHIAAAVERAWLFARSRALGAAEERNRLAREIHDTLTQRLTAVTLQLETADALLESGARGAGPRQVVRHALEMARDGLEEARRSVLDLRAAPLEGRTLAEALASLVKTLPARKKLRITFKAEGDSVPLPPRAEAALYRIAQEAVNNVVRHAQARRAAVRLSVQPEAIRLRVEDDGRGFDPARTAAGHHGLVIMNERARLVGGRLHVESTPGRGTRLEVSVPIDKG
jgi:two-component system NarL family sensor kinase